MCNAYIVSKAVDLSKKTAFYIREMFRSKEEAPAAFDFLSPPKEEKHPESSKACPTA